MEKKKRQVINPEIISRRKSELIKRDPLATELDELARGIKVDNISRRELKKRFPHYAAIEIQEQGLTGILERELQRKWNVNLYPTGELDRNVPFSWLGIYPSHPAVSDARDYINKELLPAIREQLPYEQEHFGKHGWVFLPGQGGYVCSIDEKPTAEGLKWKGTIYIPIPRGCIPILIDPRGLTKKKSKETLNKQVWDIVNKTLQKRKPQTSKRVQPISQIGDRPELSFLYSTKLSDDVFQKHLKWYDYHTKKPIGLPFRTIAVYEIMEKTSPEKFEEGKKKIEERTKIVKTGKEERVLKGVIGQSVKGEDAVEKAVKTLYFAIHGKPYPSKIKQPSYSCSKHGPDCPPSCENLKKWMKDFKKRNWKMPTLVSDKDVDTLPDPNGEQPPAKSKQRMLMDLQKYQQEEDE